MTALNGPFSLLPTSPGMWECLIEADSTAVIAVVFYPPLQHYLFSSLFGDALF